VRHDNVVLVHKYVRKIVLLGEECLLRQPEYETSRGAFDVALLIVRECIWVVASFRETET